MNKKKGNNNNSKKNQLGISAFICDRNHLYMAVV